MMSGYRGMPGLVQHLGNGARHAALVACLLAPMSSVAVAQRLAPGPTYGSRAGLEQELQGASGDQARLIRARLDSGDFRPGDRILLIVEGEKELSDTFTVGMANELTLPQIGEVPLSGVLRAELPDRLTQALIRYLRAPVVHVRSLIRVSIEGEVAKPGFYAVPPETPVMDALTAAGGLTRDAQLEKARVERQGFVVMAGSTLENAVRAGKTFDALNLRAGDRVYIPGRRNWNSSVQTLAILLTIPITIYTITQIW